MDWRNAPPVLRTGILLMLLLSTLIAAVPGISAQDATDINADGFTIPVLTSGSRVEGTLQGAVTARLYGFQGSAGDVVTITMNQRSEQLDPFLLLLGPAGEFIASDDDSGGSLSAAIEGVTLPADGAYLILATSLVRIIEHRSDVVEPLAFNLTLNGSTLPDEADPAALPVLVQTLQPGELSTVTLGPDQVAAFLAVPVEANNTFDLIVEDASFDTVLHLFDSAGARLALNDDDSRRGELTSGLYNVSVPTTGGALAIVSDVFFYMDDEDRVESQMRPFPGGELSLLLRTD